MENQNREGHRGLWALFAKLGSKLIPAIAKLGKGFKVMKVSLAAISFASYAYMFTWKFAAMIIVMLFVHESGHIWAMKQYGVKTKGIYFIPFVGGAAVAESEFPSRKAEVVIAIMGPIWGFALALVAGAVYYLTENPLFAAASSWMAMINLFNLLPINPLDGGRIFKSVAFSVRSRLGFVFLVFGILASVLITYYAKLGLFVFIIFIGSLDLFIEWRKRNPIKKQDRDALIDGVILDENSVSKIRHVIRLHEEEIRSINSSGHIGGSEHIEGCECLEKREIYSQRLIELGDWLKKGERIMWDSRKEVWGQSLSKQRYNLSKSGIWGSVAVYAVVATALWGLMYSMIHIPGSDIAMKVLAG